MREEYTAASFLVAEEVASTVRMRRELPQCRRLRATLPRIWATEAMIRARCGVTLFLTVHGGAPMTARISRARRAELQRAAQELRRQGQRDGWPVERIAAMIRVELPDILPLEAWRRLAYGWSRPQAVAGISSLYQVDGLAPPPVSPSMLCRWEHGTHPPGPEYENALCWRPRSTGPVPWSPPCSALRSRTTPVPSSGGSEAGCPPWPGTWRSTLATTPPPRFTSRPPPALARRPVTRG